MAGKYFCKKCGADLEVWKEQLHEVHKCITVSIPRPWEKSK